jgi:hypothetical protein
MPEREHGIGIVPDVRIMNAETMGWFKHWAGSNIGLFSTKILFTPQ